jgi:ribonuclease D
MSPPMTVELHRDDLPPGLTFGNAVAIDTETLGLNPYRDRLCLVQLSRGDGNAGLVQIGRHYDAPELKRLLADESVLKIFHFARFDMAVLKHSLGVMPWPIYCTKIASAPRPHLHRPARPQGPAKELLGTRALQATAIPPIGAPTS